MPSATNGYSAPMINGENVVVDGSSLAPADSVFDPIDKVVEAFANGEFVVVLDSTSRENEGDLIIAASKLTTEKAAFMVRYTSGYLCIALPEERLNALELPQMVTNNTDPNRTAYSITVDANTSEISTGISAHDRALTCRLLADPSSTADMFRRPGHMVPLRARDGGVRARRGHTEAGVDLCELAGLPKAGVLCEMVKDGELSPQQTEIQGSGMMRRDDCLRFGKKWGIKVCTIDDLVKYIEHTLGKLDTEGVDY